MNCENFHLWFLRLFGYQISMHCEFGFTLFIEKAMGVETARWMIRSYKVQRFQERAMPVQSHVLLHTRSYWHFTIASLSTSIFPRRWRTCERQEPKLRIEPGSCEATVLPTGPPCCPAALFFFFQNRVHWVASAMCTTTRWTVWNQMKAAQSFLMHVYQSCHLFTLHSIVIRAECQALNSLPGQI